MCWSFSRRSAPSNCEWRTCSRSLRGAYGGVRTHDASAAGKWLHPLYHHAYLCSSLLQLQSYLSIIYSFIEKMQLELKLMYVIKAETNKFLWTLFVGIYYMYMLNAFCRYTWYKVINILHTQYKHIPLSLVCCRQVIQQHWAVCSWLKLFRAMQFNSMGSHDKQSFSDLKLSTVVCGKLIHLYSV